MKNYFHAENRFGNYIFSIAIVLFDVHICLGNMVINRPGLAETQGITKLVLRIMVPWLHKNKTFFYLFFY